MKNPFFVCFHPAQYVGEGDCKPKVHSHISPDDSLISISEILCLCFVQGLQGQVPPDTALSEFRVGFVGKKADSIWLYPCFCFSIMEVI